MAKSIINTYMRLFESGKAIIEKEIHALNALFSSLDSSFDQVVNIILNCKGKLIVTGMGKSGLIGAKIASTFASTGVPAFFIHPGEASHGDLGMITPNDVVMIISNSGESNEIFDLLHYCKRNGIIIIGITKTETSTLGTISDYLLLLPDVPEACHIGKAPTTSTTMTLVLGDALAVTCSELKSFKESDFHNFHPGGKLGKQLLKVNDLMQSNKSTVDINSSVEEAISVIGNAKLGIVAITEFGNLVGVITDGDIRRHFLSHERDLRKIMTVNPITVSKDDLAVEVIHTMNINGISCVPVCEGSSIIGFLHLHDCLKAGL